MGVKYGWGVGAGGEGEGGFKERALGRWIFTVNLHVLDSWRVCTGIVEKLVGAEILEYKYPRRLKSLRHRNTTGAIKQ
jgi:hypothetical protein